MTVNNKPNLPREAMPWAKDIEREIAELKRLSGTLRQSAVANNAFAAGTTNLAQQHTVTLQGQNATISEASTKLVELENVTLPALESDLTELNTVTLPAMESELNTLSTVTVPGIQTDVSDVSTRVSTTETGLATLDSELGTAQAEVNTLKNTTVPALNTRLATAEGELEAAQGQITTLNNTTLPALQGELDAAEGQINTLNNTTIPNLNTAITTAQGQVNTLKDTTVPALTTRVSTAEGEITTAKTNIANAQGAINVLNTTTIPALQGELDTTEGKIDTLNNTTIPGLNATLAEKLPKVEVVGTSNTAVVTAYDVMQFTQNVTGNVQNIVIETNVGIPTMVRANIRGYNYVSATASVDLTLEAYNYTTSSISNAAYTSSGTAQIAVRYARSTNNRLVIILSPPSGGWYYPRISVSELMLSWSGATAAATQGWTASLVNEADIATAYSLVTFASARDLQTTHTLTQGWRTTGQTTIDGGKITADSVTAGQIAANAITANELAANAVYANSIQANAVVAGKIATDAVTANTILAGAVTAGKIAANAVTANTVEAGAITAGKIATNAIVADNIQSNAITTAKINAGAVTATEIATNAVTAVKIDALAITAGKIAADAVTSTTIAANAITAGKIATDAVTANTIAANAVTTAKINAGAVTATEIATDAVTATKIMAGQVTAGKIATDAVVATNIAAGAVETDKLAANAVTAAKITSGTITALQIAGGTITGDKIAANTIASEKLLVGDFTDYFNDPQFLAPTGYSPWARVVTGGVPGIQKAGTGAQNGAYIASTDIPVTAGDKLRFSAVRGTVSGTITAAAGQVGIYVQPFNAAGSGLATSKALDLSAIGVNASPEATPYTVPAGAVRLRVGFYTESTVPSTVVVRISDVQIRRVMPATLIENGAITTAKMTANTINGDRIAANTLNASKITSRTITADRIGANQITANEIAATTITANEIASGAVTSDKITANDITGKTFVGSSFVIRDAEGTDMVSLTPGVSGNFATFGSGTQQAAIGSDGSVSGASMATPNFAYRGDELSAILERAPRGVVARAAYPQFPGTNGNVTAEWGLSEIRYVTPPGGAREYRVKAAKLGIVNGSRATVFRVRYTTNGTRPTTSSTLLGTWEFESADSWRDVVIEREAAWGGNVDLRLLVTIGPGGGSGPAGWFNRNDGVEFSLIDEGLYLPRTGVISNGGASGAAPTQNYDTTYTATWVQSYIGSGAVRPDSAGKAYQGYTSFYPAGGVQRSMLGFPSQMQTDLAGATITGIDVYLYFEHWHNGSGGSAGIGLHSNATAPSTSTGITGPIVESTGWPRGAGRWVAIPQGYWAGFANGTYKGVALYVTSSASVYYGYAAGVGSAQIRVRYTK